MKFERLFSICFCYFIIFRIFLKIILKASKQGRKHYSQMERSPDKDTRARETEANFGYRRTYCRNSILEG